MNSVNRFELARRLGEELAQQVPGASAWLNDGEELTTEIPGRETLDDEKRARIDALIERASEAMAAASALEMAETHQLGTVVIADDDPNIRKLLHTILERKGFVVIEAADGAAAVECVREAQPDLVVLDWEMPNLSGRDAAEALKREARTMNIPVVMLTGRSRIEDKVEALEAGVQDFMTKPFDVREFLARIEQQVRWRRLLDSRGAPGATIRLDPKAEDAAATPTLSGLRAMLQSKEYDRALKQAMEVAEHDEERADYDGAAQAYTIASDAAAHVKNPDVANKLQRLAGKMYLLLAEHATDTPTIQRGYTMSAKMFLTAGNLKLSQDVAGRTPR